MENFLSKIFNSKNKKQVYNVDKSKKQNLKKAKKTVNQLSSTYVTNKLRKEFGIYKQKSEFSTANYNMPCVLQNREYSIESVDIIPHTFHETQNIDLVKCTEDQRIRNKSLLFINDSQSDMEPESINKEFEIDENEGCDRQEEEQNKTDKINLERVEIHNSQTLQKSSGTGGRFTELKDQEETSNSSLTTMDLRKDSLYGRYEDACVKLNSYKCNKEFIFESKRELEVHPNKVTQMSIEKTHDNQQEHNKTSLFNGTHAISLSQAKSKGDNKIGGKIDMKMEEEEHDYNKFLITKKGRVKCKSPEKEKTKKQNRSKEDDGLSRHRYYHSMIIIGGKKKTKSNNSKNIKITNTQLLEVTQKKFGNDIPNSKTIMTLDFLPCDEKRLNFLQNHSSSVRTMGYRNVNNKMLSVNIPPSEHTLKWLDENFGPGRNNTVNNSDETDLSDPMEDVSLKIDPTCNQSFTKTEIESEELEATRKNDTTHNEPNSFLSERDETRDTNSETENTSDKIENGKTSTMQRKTVRVVSFKKSRTLRSNNNSYENNLDNTDLNNNENEENSAIQNTGDHIGQSESTIVHSLDNQKNENPENELTLDITDDRKSIMNTISEDNTCQEHSNNEVEITDPQRVDGKDNSGIENKPSLDKLSSISHSGVCDTEDPKGEKGIDETRSEDCTTNLKLQNENIFKILRDQEKKSLAQKNIQEKSKDDYEAPIKKINENPSPRDDKIVLKLNDKILHVADHIENEENKRQGYMKFYKGSTEEEMKRRHEELEKDYIMTRLELALNTDVIEKPEMAKYILEKSQEVIKDVVEKTNETLTKKLLAQNKNMVDAATEVTNTIPENSIRSSEKETHISENIKNQNTISGAVGESGSKEKTVQDKEKPIPSAQTDSIQKTTCNDLNNISKIHNVKIYRKESKKASGKRAEPIMIRVNSIDNIMKNKSLLLEEIKSLKRKK